VVNVQNAVTSIACRALADMRSQGASYEEIAERFGLPTARIKQLCADLLGERDVRQWGWRSGD
jgi:DNA-binding CsgD family transcriptional regulator